MPRMSYDRFAKTAKALGMGPGRAWDTHQDTPEFKAAAEARAKAGKLPPEFYLDVNGQRVFGSITDLSNDYFDRKGYEVFKIRKDSGEFIETHLVYPPKGQGPWDALMLVSKTFADHTRPDFMGIYGETLGDLRIEDQDGIHWWMVNWSN